jgi:hypothetical protein
MLGSQWLRVGAFMPDGKYIQVILFHEKSQAYIPGSVNPHCVTVDGLGSSQGSNGRFHCHLSVYVRLIFVTCQGHPATPRVVLLQGNPRHLQHHQSVGNSHLASRGLSLISQQHQVVWFHRHTLYPYLRREHQSTNMQSTYTPIYAIAAGPHSGTPPLSKETSGL